MPNGIGKLSWRLSRFGLCRPSALMDELDLEGMDEALHWGIIVTIARATLRWCRANCRQVADIGADDDGKIALMNEWSKLGSRE